MTDEELEKAAEEYYNGQYDAWLEGEESYALEEEVEQAFKDGAEFGYNKANEWHDLRKAPNDLPLNTAPVLCLGSTGFIVCKYISGSWVDNQTIKLVPKYIDIYKWCEIEDTEE